MKELLSIGEQEPTGGIRIAGISLSYFTKKGDQAKDATEQAGPFRKTLKAFLRSSANEKFQS